MRGDTNIRELAQRLEELRTDLQDEERSIDQTLKKVGQAIRLHEQFRKNFAQGTFDVRKIERNSQGEYVERPFDWQSLDRAAEKR